MTVSPVIREMMKRERLNLQRKVIRRRKALDEAETALTALEAEIKKLP